MPIFFEHWSSGQMMFSALFFWKNANVLVAQSRRSRQDKLKGIVSMVGDLCRFSK